jgi:hypothetical protein
MLPPVPFFPGSATAGRHTDGRGLHGHVDVSRSRQTLKRSLARGE